MRSKMEPMRSREAHKCRSDGGPTVGMHRATRGLREELKVEREK